MRRGRGWPGGQRGPAWRTVSDRLDAVGKHFRVGYDRPVGLSAGDPAIVLTRTRDKSVSGRIDTGGAGRTQLELSYQIDVLVARVAQTRSSHRVGDLGQIHDVADVPRAVGAAKVIPRAEPHRPAAARRRQQRSAHTVASAAEGTDSPATAVFTHGWTMPLSSAGAAAWSSSSVGVSITAGEPVRAAVLRRQRAGRPQRINKSL
jgi:hypothetical protein